MHRKPAPERTGDRYTIRNLSLNVELAMAGKTWMLLPEGYRDQASGKKYPLPSRRRELQIISAIPIPPRKLDCGCLYIRRAIEQWRKKAVKEQSVMLDVARRGEQIKKKHEKYNVRVDGLKNEAKKALDEVREEAARQIASLSDLFALGRRGIEGQMRAYLDGKPYQGEKMNKKDHQANFRMVTQAVKGLGLPSDQRKPAGEAVLEEAAAALRATQETVALSKAEVTDPEKLN